jgi:hypothetical protein
MAKPLPPTLHAMSGTRTQQSTGRKTTYRSRKTTAWRLNKAIFPPTVLVALAPPDSDVQPPRPGARRDRKSVPAPMLPAHRQPARRARTCILWNGSANVADDFAGRRCFGAWAASGLRLGKVKNNGGPHAPPSLRNPGDADASKSGQPTHRMRPSATPGVLRRRKTRCH